MTCNDIIERAKQLADVNNTRFFSESEQFASLNESYRDIYEQILNANDDYFATDWTFNFADLSLVANENIAYTITLPIGFYRLRSLQYLLANRWPTIDKYNPINESQLEVASYRIKGTLLRLVLPNIGQYSAFRAIYFPIPETYDALTDDITFPPQLEPGILSYQISIDIKRKQKGDYSSLQDRRNELWERFTMALPKRDSWQFQPAANVYRSTDTPWR